MENEFLEPVFSRPRVKKSVLPPLQKKRKKDHAIEEISFDNSARAEYLTGFHKRKLQRKKHAEEQAAEKARQEKIELRKQIRDERKQAVENHVKNVEAMLKEAQVAGMGSDEGEEEWGGFDDEPPALEPVDHEEEYIDEDRYTTVTVESVMVDRDGLHKPELDDSEDSNNEHEDEEKQDKENTATKDQNKHPKKRKKKFRYETKVERQLTERKNKARRGRPQK